MNRRRLPLLLALLALGASPAPAAASPRPAPLVPRTLRAQAAAHRSRPLRVIVQGRGRTSSAVAAIVRAIHGKPLRQFVSIAGVDASVTGAQLLKLAADSRIAAVTPNVIARSQAEDPPPDAAMWRQSAGLVDFENPGGETPEPAVAVVDSGVDVGTLTRYGVKVVASVDFSGAKDRGDDEGHGTMVASIAGSTSTPGNPANAPIVSVRTADAQGRSRTSDVIAAADWILMHAAKYRIRVANFSMSAASDTSFRLDPLDKAIERLWFYGIVVVAAAGNHGTADGPVSMGRAPGNDPFVITVGALDQQATATPSDDTVPPWSAYGWTMDGFRKPELAAPGRYMVMPAPMDSELATARPDRTVGDSQLWMSGTSFATPVVAGAAAEILSMHPDWRPDDVKGALMLTAARTADDVGAAGVGEVDAVAAALVKDPPNPNENLYAFVRRDPATNAPSFQGDLWTQAVAVDPTWSSANWSGANWSGANWSGANWSGANWSGAAWSAANWTSDVSSAGFGSAATETDVGDIR